MIFDIDADTKADYSRVASKTYDKIKNVYSANPVEAALICTTHARLLIMVLAMSAETKDVFRASVAGMLDMLKVDAEFCLKTPSYWEEQ